jgi:hypothetical protein
MHATHAQLVEHGFALPAAANGIANCARGKNWELRQNTDASIATTTHNSGVWFCFTRKNAEQCALAAAIEANHSETIASRQRDGHVVE